MSSSTIKKDTPTPYTPPTSGLLSHLPSSWIPFAELIRLDRPQGIFLTYTPTLIGLLYGASITNPPTPPSTLLHQATKLLPTILLFRSAGCAWNDLIDQDIDRQTARCARRPIARGAISTFQGTLFTGVLFLLAFLPLQTMHPTCTVDGILTTALIIIYPFCKRVTHFAQLFLGLTLASSAVLAAHAAGAQPWADGAGVATGCVVGTIVLMVAFYDVLYACQDIEDDVRTGTKGMAVLFRDRIMVLLMGLASGVAVLFYAAAGRMGMAVEWVVVAVGGSSVALGAVVVLSQADRQGAFRGYVQWVYMVAYWCLLAGLVGNYLQMG